LEKSVPIGSQEGMAFFMPCFIKVFNKWNIEIMVECKVGNIIWGILYFTQDLRSKGLNAG
jgi:hypothetical protein